jgi:hypothetical protein
VKNNRRIVVDKPHTFGWLRRAECDGVLEGSYFEAWERPDGGIMLIQRKEYHKKIEMIVAVRQRGTVTVVSPAVRVEN